MTRTLGYSVLLLGGLALALCGAPSGLARAVVRAAAHTARPATYAAHPAALTACPAASTAPSAAEPRFRAPLREARSCKPRAPIELRLEQVGASDGSVVDLQLEVAPHPSVGAVRWELLLPDGAELLDGESDGELAAGAAGTGPRHVRVRLPRAADFSRVSLVAGAGLDESAAPAGPADRVGTRLSLGWGQPPAAAPGRQFVDVARGDRQRVAIVPATHRAGR